MTTTPLRAILWSAVSTVAQANEEERFSLTDQIERTRKAAADMGAVVIDELIVPGHSRKYRTLESLASAGEKRGITAFRALQSHLDQADFDVLICRDANRFARSASLLHYIVECVIEDCGARIYSLVDGWVDASIADVWAMVKGYTTNREMAVLKENVRKGEEKRAARGLAQTGSVPFSHMRVFNASGKETGLAVNPDSQQIVRDAVTLLLEGVGLHRIEQQLADRFAYRQADGRPWPPGTFYKLFNNPLFWGNQAVGAQYYQRFSGWVYDSMREPPAGVIVHYGVSPAALPPDLLEQVRAEMIRRSQAVGSRRPNHSYALSGLFVCGECGRLMTVQRDSRVKGKLVMRSLRCTSRWSAARPHPCVANKGLSYRRAMEYVERTIEEFFTTGTFQPESNAAVAADPMSTLTAERDRLSKTAAGLARELAMAEGESAVVLRAELMSVSERLRVVKRDLNAAQAERAESEHRREASMAAAQKLVNGGLGNRPPNEANQLLHAALGDRRFVVKDGVIVGHTTRKRGERL